MILYLAGWAGLLVHRVLETLWQRLQYRDPQLCSAVAPLAGELPLVTVQLPVCNEFYVVERLIDGCCALDYPRDRFEVQVLDDSTDATSEVITRRVAHHAAQGVDIVHLQRGDRTGFKAGNLQHGLATAKGSFIAIFDADCVPDRDFLLKILPYFRDPAVGIVYPRIVRHRNRDRSVLTRAQDPNGDRLPYRRPKQRYYASAFFNFFFGSPGLVRTACLLDVGGWHGDTVCEDADFSVRSYLKGWRCVLVDERLATDDVLERMDGVKNQFTRWKTGNAECYRKHLADVLRSRTITPLQKFALFAALHAPWLYVPSVTAIALASVPLLVRPQAGWAYQAAVALPSLVTCVWLVVIAIGRNSAAAMNLLLHLGLYPRVSWGVIKGLLGLPTPFVRSTKLNSDDAASRANLYPITFTPAILVEAGLSLYFLFAVYWGLRFGNYWLLPFHLLCLCSYAFIVAVSVRDVLAGSARTGRQGLLET